MGYNDRRCRLVPHKLSGQRGDDGLKQSRELFDGFQDVKKLWWIFILTRDESWFFFIHKHEKLWLPPDADALEVSRHLMSTPKVMVTLFWNRSGLYISNCLAADSVNADDFVPTVLNTIHSLPIMSAAHRPKKRFILYMDIIGSRESQTVPDAGPSLSATSLFTGFSSSGFFPIRISQKENARP
jgi:hypothetical protein